MLSTEHQERSATRRRWRRVRPRRDPVAPPDATHVALPRTTGRIRIAVDEDFVRCSQPRCCVLRPLGDPTACPGCGRV